MYKWYSFNLNITCYRKIINNNAYNILKENNLKDYLKGKIKLKNYYTLNISNDGQQGRALRQKTKRLNALPAK